MRVLSVVGARPNFVKAAPLIAAMKRHPAGFRPVLVHTGQHYDAAMSGGFFDDLRLPEPDHRLGVGSGSHAQQTAAVMAAIEPIMQTERPDLVLVVGDVNSTLAAALTAKKLGLRLGHVEAGLRSFDRAMPEEINRLCVDAIADEFYVTDAIAAANLEREGAPAEHVHLVGNVMIDALLAHLQRAERTPVLERLRLEPGGYAVMTLHRPANVDDPMRLRAILEAMVESVGDRPIVFPVHPRTRKALGAIRARRLRAFRATPPLGYLEFLHLVRRAKLVATDSGGLQEETTALGVPCVTLRETTERPITVSEGTNRLGGVERRTIVPAIAEALRAPSAPRRPPLWDGQAAERIVEIIARRAA